MLLKRVLRVSATLETARGVVRVEAETTADEIVMRVRRDGGPAFVVRYGMQPFDMALVEHAALKFLESEPRRGAIVGDREELSRRYLELHRRIAVGDHAGGCSESDAACSCGLLEEHLKLQAALGFES
jgi:hypothetical protein